MSTLELCLLLLNDSEHRWHRISYIHQVLKSPREFQPVVVEGLHKGHNIEWMEFIQDQP